MHRMAQQPLSTAPTPSRGRASPRFPGTSNSVRLYVRIQQPGSSAYDGYMLRTIQQAGTDQVLLERIDNGTLVTRLTINQELAAGDTLLLRAKGTTIEAWRNDGSSWTRLGVVTDSTYGAAGYTGIGLRGTTGPPRGLRRADDGRRPRHRPERSAVPAGDRRQRPGLLALDAPSSDGGSAITGYRVYRGTAPNPTVALTPDLGVVTSFLDTGRTNGQIYYYKVTALNAIGESSPRTRRMRRRARPPPPRALRSPCRRPPATPRSPRAGALPPRTAARAITGYRVYRGTAPNPTAPSPPISAW